MASNTLPPNEELVLTRAFRDVLAHNGYAGCFVSNQLPVNGAGDDVAPAQAYAVIIRSDGGPAGDGGTYTRRIGVRIFGPRDDIGHKLTGQLARYTAAVLCDIWGVVVEVAAVRNINGPYRVPPTVERPEMYITAELVMVGTPIEINLNGE